MSPDTDLNPAGAGERLGDVTRRRLLVTITGMATPIVLGQLSQTLMGLVDTLMVGRLGEAPLAAVGVATLLFSALAMSIKAVDVAAQSFTARRVGEGRDAEVGSVLATAVTVSMAAGAVFMLVGLLWPGTLVGLVTTDPEVRELGRSYLLYRYAGMLPLLFFFQAKAVFDGIGWTRIGMGVGIGMNLLNVLLNWMFIFGKLGAPALGVGGAALASTLSALAAAVVILGFLLRSSVRRRFRILCRSNFQRRLIGPFLKLAWPPALQTFGIVIGFLVFYFILGRISIIAVAAANVVMRIASLSFMPGFGVGAAVQTLVGQSLGREDPVGARRSSWYGVGLSMVFMGIFGVIFLWVPEFLMRLFSSSEELIAAGVPILRLMGLVQLIDAVGLTLAGALRGAGMTREVMFVDVATGFGLLPPLAYLFGVVMKGGLMGAWLALLTWFTLYAVGMVLLFVKSRWEEVKI
ncbi:MAG: MATE family efflux transporter [Candidatus Krumholzibacteriota bacterium]